MTTTSVPNQATPPSPFRRAVSITIAIIAAIVVAFFWFASLFADWLWFEQLGFESVLLTQWIARIAMFAIGFLAMAIPVFIAIQLAYRLRPVYARLSSQLDHYQEVVEPLRRLAMWGIPVFFGFFAGFAASAQWETVWMWLNRVDTGDTDPQFGMDTGFYLFSMPLYASVLSFASAVLLVCLLLSALVSYLYGAVRVGQRELRISKSARIQLAVLAGLYLLVQAASLYLDRFKTLVEPSGRITGASYVDDKAIIPGLTILAIAAAIVALLFFVTAIIGRWRFPLIGVGLLVASSLVVGVAYPWFVNQFQVIPNQETLESPYYQRNLDATKLAYGIDGLEKSDFRAVTDAEPGQLRADAETTASIRIMDPAIIPPTVRQLEQYRPYYQFSDPLDVDRYTIDGVSQDTVMSVRELNLNQLGQAATWFNTTLVYTHGYGLVAAKGNGRTPDGNPDFLERGIPTGGVLTEQTDYEPRVYFGENSPPYSIVGAPEGSTPIEIDYPRGSEGGAAQTKTTFEGNGGPSIGDMFSRIIYALKFQSTDILLSDAVNEKSQILYDRDPLLRVEKVAPYLELDSDPYPSIVDGRIVWIVDGYTRSATYPYSSVVSLRDAISDTTNQSPRVALDDINYIRNAVKATVDAYDGSVTLYAWDETDPLLQAWQQVYPGTLKPIADMSADLMSHVRYPTDLFKVQRAMLGTYHVDDAASFYARDNAWRTPQDPVTQANLQPPYYLTMQMPGQDAPSYSMFTSFIPASEGENARNVLMGYLAVDSNAGNVAGTRSEGYGKLRMLEISADVSVPGPGQVQNTFNSDETISSQINLLKQGQSEVLNGNLLTLPVGGGLLYVQPVFVQASSGTQLPTLRKILVAFGDEVAFEDTLQDALDALFGGDSGVDTGDGGTTPTPQPTDPVDPETPGGGTDTGNQAAIQAALNDARDAMVARDAALKAGDLAAFAAADAKLTAAVELLLSLSGG